MKDLIYEKDGGYYIRGEHQEPGSEEGRSELTQWQYDSIRNLQHGPVSDSLTEADILRLHQEQDPASPLFKGSEPAGDELSESNSGEAESTHRYYEPTSAEIEAAAAKIQDPAGTTTITTEQATIPPVIGETSNIDEEVKPKKGK